MATIIMLLCAVLPLVASHGYLTCPLPRMYRDEKPEVWTHWMGITVPGDEAFNPGEGNAPNLNAGIGGGMDGAAREQSEGHGLCGDIGSRQGFMAGGEYGPTAARGTYVAGGQLDVNVKLTAYHAGWFEFRLCVPADGGADYSSPITQECLNEHVLEIDPSTPDYDLVTNYAGMVGISAGGDGGWYKCAESGGFPDPTSNTPNTVWPSGSCCYNGGDCSDPAANTHRYVVEFSSTATYEYEVVLKVPEGIVCERCVLQWFYQTANSRETFPESFWNCADVRINAEGTGDEIGCTITDPPADAGDSTTPSNPSTPSDGTGDDDGDGGGTEVVDSPWYCSTNWGEWVLDDGSVEAVTCTPCVADSDCADGRSCWASTYCLEGVLCGEGECAPSAPTTDFDCSIINDLPDGALCSVLTNACNDWCVDTSFSSTVVCDATDDSLPEDWFRHTCECSSSSANGVCLTNGAGSTVPSSWEEDDLDLSYQMQIVLVFPSLTSDDWTTDVEALVLADVASALGVTSDDLSVVSVDATETDGVSATLQITFADGTSAIIAQAIVNSQTIPFEKSLGLVSAEAVAEPLATTVGGNEAGSGSDSDVLLGVVAGVGGTLAVLGLGYMVYKKCRPYSSEVSKAQYDTRLP